MGRPRKIVALNRKHFTKEELAARENAEREHRVGRDELQAPEHLSTRAKEEFARIVRQAFWLDDLDRDALSIYCFCLDKALSIMEEYDAAPEVLEMKSGDGKSKLVTNPLRRALREYSAEMRSISLKLGLTSIDRLRLVAPSASKKANKFLQLVK